MKVERRQYTRLLVPPGDFTVLSPECTVRGNLKDISQAGLAMHYRASKRRDRLEWTTINIVRDDRPCLSGIPCRTIYDISALTEDQDFRGTENRRRGLQYGKLTEEQKRKLDCLLNKIVNGSWGDPPQMDERL